MESSDGSQDNKSLKQVTFGTRSEAGQTFGFTEKREIVQDYEAIPAVDMLATKKSLNEVLQKQKGYDKKFRQAMDQCKIIFVHGVEHKFDQRDPIFKL